MERLKLLGILGFSGLLLVSGVSMLSGCTTANRMGEEQTTPTGTAEVRTMPEENEEATNEGAQKNVYGGGYMEEHEGTGTTEYAPEKGSAVESGTDTR